RGDRPRLPSPPPRVGAGLAVLSRAGADGAWAAHQYACRFTLGTGVRNHVAGWRSPDRERWRTTRRYPAGARRRWAVDTRSAAAYHGVDIPPAKERSIMVHVSSLPGA